MDYNNNKFYWNEIDGIRNPYGKEFYDYINPLIESGKIELSDDYKIAKNELKGLYNKFKTNPNDIGIKSTLYCEKSSLELGLGIIKKLTELL